MLEYGWHDRIWALGDWKRWPNIHIDKDKDKDKLTKTYRAQTTSDKKYELEDTETETETEMLVYGLQSTSIGRLKKDGEKRKGADNQISKRPTQSFKESSFPLFFAFFLLLFLSFFFTYSICFLSFFIFLLFWQRLERAVDLCFYTLGNKHSLTKSCIQMQSNFAHNFYY